MKQRAGEVLRQLTPARCVACPSRGCLITNFLGAGDQGRAGKIRGPVPNLKMGPISQKEIQPMPIITQNSHDDVGIDS